MKWFDKTDRALRSITRVAGLNLTWLLFTALGLGVLGVFPATMAMFYVARHWVTGEQDVPLWHTFQSRFRASFWRANLGGWLVVGCCGLLYLNFRIIVAAEGAVPLVIVLSFLLILALFAMVVSALLPVAAHFDEPPLALLKKALFFALGRPHIAVLFPLTIWAVAWLSMALPAFFLFFSGSVTACVLMWLFTCSLRSLTPVQASTSN
ncbi:DUF624 domain-containing protein [Natronospirillum operosum]|uniref:DUF624 domain-containing protein n=1 Tax=Natronospirillum operosum TaxID=2759953 RepID=A0A4Z0W8Z7_9GAMM|nr:DUF624 domain-containing protein [Natronospirillum operosum]TGG93479.1 DUF624 domain-containing protein [Natronospirillum operosum]